MSGITGLETRWIVHRAVAALLWILPLLWYGWVLVRAVVEHPDLAGDLYPQYFGARSLLDHGNAYDFTWLSAPTSPNELARWEVGNFYPLPAVVLFGLPGASLPPMLAAVCFTTLCLTATVFLLRRASLGPALLWWMPVIEAVGVSQFELAVVVGYLLLWVAHREGSVWLAGVAVLILSCKPHAGLAGLAMALLWFRPSAVRVFAPATLLWAASVAWLPSWPALWVEQLLQRNDRIAAGHFLGNLALVIPACLVWIAAARSQGRLERAGLLLSGTAVFVSALHPWPFWYPAAAWLVGLPRLVAATAAASALVLVTRSPHPAVLAVSLALGLALQELVSRFRLTTRG